MSEIVIYQNAENRIEVEVTYDQDTFWMNLNQISELFERDKSVISRHLRNIFQEGELDKAATVAKNATVQIEGEREVVREIEFYNLDAILSVGYRVNSRRGTQFRQWATQRLKDYLVQGYAINQKRLEQTQQEVRLLRSGIQILSRVIEEKSEDTGLEWLQSFAMGLKLLDDYDHEALDTKGLTTRPAQYPSRANYQSLIDQMKADFASAVFGVEKDNSFESAIQQIAQGFGNQDIYATLEEKAAMLLYLIVKNHAFVDGNKRIAAVCFLLFLQTNDILYQPDGNLIISNEALASLTLFVAASKSEEMEIVKKLIISVLNRNQ